jgi:hypothetical protein
VSDKAVCGPEVADLFVAPEVAAPFVAVNANGKSNGNARQSRHHFSGRSDILTSGFTVIVP